MPQLATDLDNRDFVGAQNPDDLLTVRFYKEAMPNQYQSVLQGRPIFDDVILISIMTPGNQLSEIIRYATNLDKIKFKRQWDFFEATQGSGDQMQHGTPLEQWPLLSKGQAAMLKAIKFFSIEQIAGASDEQLQGMGMHGGMSAYILRDKARAFLNVAKNANFADEQAQLAKKQSEENATLKVQIEAQAEQQREMLANMEALKQMLQAQQAPEKQKRTRRTKAQMQAAQG